MFDWDEYIELALMLEQLETEAARRSAISRAYYAVFCTARDWLFARGYVLTDGRRIHRAIWNEFIFQRQQSVWATLPPEHRAEATSLGNHGFRLLGWRQRADYQGRFPSLESKVRIELARAVAVRDGLRGL